jgi:hypothetical protein
VYWVVDLGRRRTVVHREPYPGAEPHYADLVTVPFADGLDVLGVTLRLGSVLG